MTTFALGPATHDLTLDPSGNFALHTDTATQTAQDVATSIMLWRGEYVYDRERGVPWRERILGKPIHFALLQSYIAEAAAHIPTVAAVSMTMPQISRDARAATPDITVRTTEGETVNVPV